MHIRRSIKLAVLILLSVVIIGMMIVYFFKPTYSVSLNGEFIGYTQNKSELQAKINDAIQKGDGANLAKCQFCVFSGSKILGKYVMAYISGSLLSRRLR